MRFLRWFAIGFVMIGGLASPAAAGSDEEAPPSEPAPKLDVSIDKTKVDLKGHRLEVRMNHVASKVTIKVFDEDGAVIADESHDFVGRAAGTPLLISWSPSSDAVVGRIEVFGYDESDAYKGVAITPWSLSIPHDEVNFRRDSSEIADPEKPKLEATFGKVTEAIAAHRDLGRITLYIAGHTDTVGTPAHNFQLSRARAQSIASWFRRRGLKIPIAYEGFGESALLVKTADEVDEVQNRRIEYVLSLDEPNYRPGGFRPVWKRGN